MIPRPCHCACGHVAFDVTGPPLFRILCHCTICQAFNRAAFADVVVHAAKSVQLPATGTVEFGTYKPPPNVQRGKCAKCGQAAIEVFKAPLLPALTIVPAGMFNETAALPTPVAHIFYNRRLEDADDHWPKHQGFIRSQLAFGKYLLGSMFARKART